MGGEHAENFTRSRDQGRRLDRERVCIEHDLACGGVEKVAPLDAIYYDPSTFLQGCTTGSLSVVYLLEELQERPFESFLCRDFQDPIFQKLDIPLVGLCHFYRNRNDFVKQF